MTESPRQMNLCLFLSPGGYHAGGWRMSSSPEVLVDFQVAMKMALQAERAKMDAVFMADHLSYTTGSRPTSALLEPLTCLGALAVVTSQIGLIATASTSFTEPYNLARYFASIDHLSGGRAAWNIVTSYMSQENFTTELHPHDERYTRAFEYMAVVTALWDSWQDDALVADKGSGEWIRAERIHPVNFAGKYFDVAGPFNIPRSPQGWPVLVQAGSSASGVDFAASYAEMIFTVQQSLNAAQDFYTDVKTKAAAKGRDSSKIRILPGLMPIIGESDADARRLADELADLVAPDAARRALGMQLGSLVDFDGLDFDQPIPPERFPAPETVQGARGRYELYYQLAVKEGRTLRELAKVASASAGHSVAIGTAEQVADVMQKWFVDGGSDGFNLQPPYLMDGLDKITDQLIPELQRRGLFRTEYEGSTFRDHLGLARPAGRTAEA